MSKTNELADKVLATTDNKLSGLYKLKEGTIDYLANAMADARDILGELPDEKAFKDLIAEILDRTIIRKYVPFLYRKVFAIFGITKKIVYAVDKYGLDRLFGESWFDTIKKRACLIIDTKINANS